MKALETLQSETPNQIVYESLYCLINKYCWMIQPTALASQKKTFERPEKFKI
jgi:hypothetical protein